jgi:segregation and condensation protein A
VIPPSPAAARAAAARDADVRAAATVDDDAPFRVHLSAFEGTLAELAQALRSRRLTPGQVDLLLVVREVLARFQAFAARDLDRATEALPPAATVVELKARLLLPRPPRPAEEEDEAARADALAAVAALEALEDAIAELRARRERRRHLLPARAPAPPYARSVRPLGIALDRLTELAARLRPGPYFELVRERLTVSAAIGRILDRLRPGQRSRFDELVEDATWATRTVYFAGALELVREGRCRLHQPEAFGPIEVEGAHARRAAAGAASARAGEGDVGTGG